MIFKILINFFLFFSINIIVIAQQTSTQTIQSSSFEISGSTNQVIEQELSKTYKIIKGDTLWDIANNFYDNPNLWKKLWYLNKDAIKNPDLIYPQQEIKIISKEKLIEVKLSTDSEYIQEQKEKTEISEMGKNQEKNQIQETETQEVNQPETQTLTEEIQEQEKPETVKKETEQPETTEETINLTTSEDEYSQENSDKQQVIEKISQAQKVKESDTFIVKKDFKFDGNIIETKEKKNLIVQGDTVFINAGTKNGLKPNMKCNILRITGNIQDKGKIIGKKMKKIGLIKITNEISDDSAIGIITMSHEPVLIGDYIKILK